MNRKRILLPAGLILIVCIFLGLNMMLDRVEPSGLRIACNDDAAGLLVKYLAGEGSSALEVVDMSYQQLQDCCNSQTELALSAGNFDLAVLCPDSADKLIASGQPYQVLGPVVVNANVLVTNQDTIPRTVGYMNLREIQKKLVWSNLDNSIVMKPMLPAGLPYALERDAVEGIVLDILGALKISGYRLPLLSEYPSSVLVVHENLLGSTELESFIKAYNQAVGEINTTGILMKELKKNLSIENSSNEVKIWREMGIQFQPIEIPN